MNLFSFLVQLVTVAEVVLFAAAALGLLAHFASKRARGEISGSLWYYLVSTPGFTFATLIGLLAACVAIVATGQIETMALHVVVALGFTTGWTFDSAIAPHASDATPAASGSDVPVESAPAPQ